MSIKKKFATAVATASLLAGLFGSAFVPSAMAGIVDGSTDATFRASYTTVTTYSEDWADTSPASDTAIATNAWMNRVGTTGNAFGFQSDWATVASADYESALGFSLYLSDRSDLDLTAVGFDDVQLKATSSNAAIRIAWAYEDDGTEATCGDSDVEANLAASSTFVDILPADMDGDQDHDRYWLCVAAKLPTTAATSTITVTVGGVVAKTVTVTAVGPMASAAVALNYGKYVAVGDDYELGNLEIDDMFTITAKDAAGTVINGSQRSVSPMDSSSLWMDDSDDQVENQAGDVIDANDTHYFESDGATSVAYSQADLSADVCLHADSFDEFGDEGQSYSLSFKVWNEDNSLNDDDEEYTETNSITITCTGGLDGARITKVTAEATSGGTTYEETGDLDDGDLILSATIVDADGAPLGNGAGDVDAAFGTPTFSPSAYDSGELEYSETGDTEAVDGIWEFGMLNPDTSRAGKFTYKLTWDDANLGVALDQELVGTLTYTASFAGYDGDISRTRNAAKTTAVFTADFGEVAAYSSVKFLVELPTGVIREFNRRANGAGVATFTYSRRTIVVYVSAELYDGATFLGGTDTIRTRFR